MSPAERIAAAAESLKASWGEEKVAAWLEEQAAVAERARLKKRGGILEARAVLHQGVPAELWCNGVRLA